MIARVEHAFFILIADNHTRQWFYLLHDPCQFWCCLHSRSWECQTDLSTKVQHWKQVEPVWIACPTVLCLTTRRHCSERKYKLQQRPLAYNVRLLCKHFLIFTQLQLPQMLRHNDQIWLVLPSEADQTGSVCVCVLVILSPLTQQSLTSSLCPAP